MFGPQHWDPTLAFVITQAPGKKRSIVDAKRGGQNAVIGSQEKTVLCDATHPAYAARMLCSQAAAAGVDLAKSRHELTSGGEDMPDAYRHVLAHPSDHDVNIVAIRHPVSGWAFQVLWGLCFGHASSAYSFIRWSRFLEAVARRCGALMWTKFLR